MAPLKINLILKGGYTMEYKIEEREAFKVVGLKDSFKYETAYQEIPKIWKRFFMKNTFNKIKLKYAVNIDTNMKGDLFDYIIGDDYNSELKVPKDFEIIEIPKFTWVVFSCMGPANMKMQETNITIRCSEETKTLFNTIVKENPQFSKSNLFELMIKAYIYRKLINRSLI